MFALVITVATVIGAVHGQSILLGGKYVTVAQYPYQVSFLFSNGGHFCSGFLISRDIVVTAAHCVYDLDKTEIQTYKIRAGSSYFNKGGQVVQVEAAIVHPGYSELTNDNDIALLRLASPITDKNAKYANMPNLDEDIFPFTHLNITGWGTNKEGNEIPAQMQMIPAKKIRSHNCIRIYPTKLITENQFCVISPDKTSCSADCGDPAVVGNTVYGIYSRGINCADYHHPSVYTRIAFFRDWIFQNSGI